MMASGHSSVQMHKRYLDLQREDVAKAFGLLQDGNTYGRRRKVPGGAAGLQNWKAHFLIVQQRRRFSDKSAFLFSYLVFSRSVIFFSNCRGRTIFTLKLLQEWQQGMAIRAAAALRCSYDIASCDQSTPRHLNFGKPRPLCSPRGSRAKIFEI